MSSPALNPGSSIFLAYHVHEVRINILASRLSMNLTKLHTRFQTFSKIHVVISSQDSSVWTSMIVSSSARTTRMLDFSSSALAF